MTEDKELERPRKHIDEADRKIIDALEERMDIVINEIKPLKKDKQLDPHDERRVKEVLETRVSMGSKLNSTFVRELFHLIIKESERLQDK
ncbi:chorismate mutase [Candidatus Kaiserbacteria bacterium]|nr:chorismate mutase [Candidatus Kaiserbacteria bacterium]